MVEIKDSFRKRYSYIHPLILARSAEKANTEGELFDILEDFPLEVPVVWSESKRRWKVVTQLFIDPNF